MPGKVPVGSEAPAALAVAHDQLAQQAAQAAQEAAADAQIHARSNQVKEVAGGLAVFGVICLGVGIFFPPAAAVGLVALEISQVALEVAIAADVAVAITHPTQDNWVTVGGDVVAVALGYAVGKVVVGPLLGALARRFGPAAGEAVAAETAAETAAAKAEADRIAAYKAKQNSPEGQAEQAARAAKKQRGAEKARLDKEQKAQADAAKRRVAVEPSRTQPSRAPNPEAKPGGRRAKVEGNADKQQSIRRENEAADHAAKAGYEVEQNPTVAGSKNPDYRIEGKVFDGYSPQGDNLNTIRDTMSGKVADGQTRRLLINLDDAPTVSVKDISTLSQQVKASTPDLEEVLVWKNGQFHHVYP